MLMSEFYGLVYDYGYQSFRLEAVEGLEGVIGIADYVADFTSNDEEPFEEPIDTLEQALDFLEDYNYGIFIVNKEEYDLFNKLVDEDVNEDNRLSFKSEEKFFELTKKRLNDYEKLSKKSTLKE